MSITLKILPQTPPRTWAQFCTESEPFSIALDGYVADGPRFDPSGPRANFNHHETVNRLATRATCGQILIAIRQGLFSRFRNARGQRAVLYANDCDEDVCLSVFLLRNSHMVVSAMNPLINRLVSMEDVLDTTAGAYPYPRDLPALGELAWVFQPYRRFRLSGGLDEKDPAAFEAVLTDVCNRIIQHVVGKGQTVELDTRYERIGGGKNWALVREIGANGRTGMFSDGIRAYVSVRERPNGRRTVTVGRMSPFIDFDVPSFIAKCNEEEGLTDDEDRWGGGDNIGGSPRVAGSDLTDESLTRIAEDIIDK
jgi:hypothetical protein